MNEKQTLVDKIKQLDKPHNYIELTYKKLNGAFSKSYIQKVIYGIKENYLILDATISVINEWEALREKIEEKL